MFIGFVQRVDRWKIEAMVAALAGDRFAISLGNVFERQGFKSLCKPRLFNKYLSLKVAKICDAAISSIFDNSWHV